MPKHDRPYLIVNFPDLDNVLPPRNCPGCGAAVISADACYENEQINFRADRSAREIQNDLELGHSQYSVDQVFELIAKIITEKPKSDPHDIFEGSYYSATVEYGCKEIVNPDGTTRRNGATYWGERNYQDGGLVFTTSTFESGDYSCDVPSIEVIEKILSEMRSGK